jgi:hypothetical protein
MSYVAFSGYSKPLLILGQPWQQPYQYFPASQPDLLVCLFACLPVLWEGKARPAFFDRAA